jgi:hypothetical protein
MTTTTEFEISVFQTHEEGENCTTDSFVMCNLQQILLGRLNMEVAVNGYVTRKENTK